VVLYVPGRCVIGELCFEELRPWTFRPWYIAPLDIVPLGLRISRHCVHTNFSPLCFIISMFSKRFVYFLNVIELYSVHPQHFNVTELTVQ
jgi:hypothetical protein